MPKKCCIPNCKIQEDDPESLNLSFFQIPKDESVKKQWLTIINNHFKTEIKLPKLPHICSLHFEQTSFNLGPMAVRVRLKKEACPSIFKDRSSIFQNKDNNINEQVASRDSSDDYEMNNKIDENLSLSNGFGKCINKTSDISSNDGTVLEKVKSSSNEEPQVNHLVSSSSLSVSGTVGQSDSSNATSNTIQNDPTKVIESTKNFCEIPNETLIKSVENICSDDKNTIQIQKPLNQSNIIGHNNSSNKILDKSPQLKCSPNSGNEHLEYQCAKAISSKIYQKSFANINIGSINFKDETVVRALFKKAQNEIRDVRRKYRIQAMKFYRAQKKIKSYGNLVHHMKKRRFLNEKVSQMLEDTVPPETQEIINRLLKIRKRKRKFPQTLRKFAMTLHLYSPEAYNYVRKTFIKCLPHPATVAKWYRKIEISSEVNKASIETLKDKVTNVKSGNKPILCNLTKDEVDIREKI